MGQLDKGIAILTIGGADGLTSIYVSKMYLFPVILIAVIITVLFLLAIYRSIKNIKRKNKIRSILYSIVILFLFIFIPTVSILSIKEYKWHKPLLNAVLRSSDRLSLPDDNINLGIYIEAENFDYFRINNKIINVQIGFAGTGFLIGKKIDSESYKVVEEIYSSGVYAVSAEDSYIGTVKGNILKINENEYFTLENNTLRYFNKNKEYPIYGIEDNWINDVK